MKTIVVVPIYKRELDYFETIALKQLFRILYNHKIVFIMPEGLNADIEAQINISESIERVFFDKSFFEDKSSYSRMCLSTDFYKRFDSYDYMLIYQTDAFVFSDRLDEFIELGYDYIGAPQKNDGWNKFHVGNGGLSLRRISKCIEMLSQKDTILGTLPIATQKVYLDYEDNFWGYCGYNTEINFSVPTIEEAAEFSLQDNSLNVYGQLLEKGLPFGLHGWPYCDYGFWKSIIEIQGYELPSEEKVIAENQFMNGFYENRRNWIADLCPENSRSIVDIIGLNSETGYIIWGNGHYGKIAVSLFKQLGLSIEKIFDISCKQDFYYDGIPVSYPKKECIYNQDLVVAVIGRYDEIYNELIKMGYSKEKKVWYIEKIISDIKVAFGIYNPYLDVFSIREKVVEALQKR